MLPVGARVRGVPRCGARRVELGQEAAGRADHEGGECPRPVAASRGGVAHRPLAERGDGYPAGLGERHRHVPRQAGRDGGARASVGGYAVRNVARRSPVQGREGPSTAPAGSCGRLTWCDPHGLR